MDVGTQLSRKRLGLVPRPWQELPRGSRQRGEGGQGTVSGSSGMPQTRQQTRALQRKWGGGSRGERHPRALIVLGLKGGAQVQRAGPGPRVTGPCGWAMGKESRPESAQHTGHWGPRLSTRWAHVSPRGRRGKGGGGSQGLMLLQELLWTEGESGHEGVSLALPKTPRKGSVALPGPLLTRVAESSKGEGQVRGGWGLEEESAKLKERQQEGGRGLGFLSGPKDGERGAWDKVREVKDFLPD